MFIRTLTSLLTIGCIFCNSSRNPNGFPKQPDEKITDIGSQHQSYDQSSSLFNPNRPPKYPKRPENLAASNYPENKPFSALQVEEINKTPNEDEKINSQKNSEDQGAKKKFALFSNLQFNKNQKKINVSENEQFRNVSNDHPMVTKSYEESNKIIREPGIDSVPDIRRAIGPNSTKPKHRTTINSNNFQLNRMARPPLPKPALNSRVKTEKTTDSIIDDDKTTISGNKSDGARNYLIPNESETTDKHRPDPIYPIRILARPNVKDYSDICGASTSSKQTPIGNKEINSSYGRLKKDKTSLTKNDSDFDLVQTNRFDRNFHKDAIFRNKRNLTSLRAKHNFPIVNNNNFKSPNVFSTSTAAACESLENKIFRKFYNDVEETATNPFLKELKNHLLRTVEERQNLKEKYQDKLRRKRLENQVKAMEKLRDKINEGPSCKNGPSQELIDTIKLLQITQRELLEADRDVEPFVNISHSGRRSYYKGILRSILKNDIYPQNLTRDFFKGMPKRMDDVPPDTRNQIEEICREIEDRLNLPYNANVLSETEEGVVEVVGKYLNSDDFVRAKAVLLGKCFMEFGYIDLAILSGPVVFNSQRKTPLHIYTIGARLGKEDPPIDYLVVDYIIQTNGIRLYGF